MQRRFFTPLFTLVILILVSSTGTLPASAQTSGSLTTIGERFTEVEPNDSPAQATPIAPGVVRGSLFPANDWDYYSFSATAGDRLYALTMTSASASSSTDSVLELYGPDGTTLIEHDNDDGSFSSNASSIAGAVLPTTGTYYLRVRHNQATGQLFPYDLYMHLQRGTPGVESEPNDDPSNANPLPASGWVAGTFDVANDVDIYSLELNAGDTIVLSLDLDPERDGVEVNGRLGFGLFGSSFLAVNDQGLSTPDSEAFPFTVLNSGTYHIYVDAPAAGTYQLSAMVIPAPTPAGVCTTYTSSDVPLPIPSEPGMISSTLDVPDNLRITDVDLLLTLNHTLMSDLDMVLVSPGGNAVSLFNDIGSNTSGVNTEMNIRLDDDAALPIGTFTVVKDIVYQPEATARLEWFEGMQAQGTWTLQLYDDAAGDAGTLLEWGLRICGEPEQPPVAELACPANTRPAVVYSSTFDDDDGGFTSSGVENEWEWGLPSAAPLDDCASGNCWKTDLDNTYNASSNQDLTSPALDLSRYVGEARVVWSQKYQLERADFDHAWFEVRTTDASEVSRLWEWLGPTMTQNIGNPAFTLHESAGWARHSADISAYLGRTIELNAHLDSDDAIQFAGYAIDDVSVVACEPLSDLVITTQVTPGVGTLLPGQPLTYTLAFTNTGPALATGVRITDILPVELVLPSFTSSGVLVTDTGALPPFQWAVADVAAGAGGTISVSARVDPTLSADRVLTNTVTISSANELDPANNSAQVVAQVVVPRVSVLPAVGVVEGGSATLTVTLDTPNPYAPVTVSYSTSDGSASAGSDYSSATGTLTIPPGETEGSITLTTLPDALSEGEERFTLTLSNPVGAVVQASSATITIFDDDTPGVLVEPLNLSVREGGPSASYTVRLLSQPSAAVTVVPSGDAQVMVSPSSLTFTPANWDVAQTVSVTAVDDALVEGEHSAQITHVVTSADSAYDGLAVASVTVTILDNDEPEQPVQRLFLPLLHTAPALPDLTVSAIRSTGGVLEIVITNQGGSPVTAPFWVDLYIAPERAPSAPNEVWYSVGTRGMSWGVTGAALPLAPGASLTLRPGDGLYRAADSNPGGTIEAGTVLYVQVDSASVGSAFGAVFEQDEQGGGSYNNISATTAASTIALPRALRTGANAIPQ